MTLTIQLFGTKKCRDSRAAERFFKERGVSLHMVDLSQKAMSPGELRNVAARVGGFEALIDREGKRYVDKGLKYAAPTGPRIEQILVDDPLLLRTPIVRAGGRATVGYAPETWTAWLAQLKEEAPR
jgi:arsenate reductase